MATGLIGWTGFVGGNIARQRQVDLVYRKADVAQIRGQQLDVLWISGAPAQKWVANADPEGDAAALAELVDHLRAVQARQVVLVSTVDVYPLPRGVDEDVVVDVDAHSEAYGRNRLRLEHDVQALFERVLVVRLPGLFGPGLKKNLVFDLLHEREEFAHRDSTFQFYDVGRLCDDVETALGWGLTVLNLATEPVSATEVAREVFGRTLLNEQGTRADYDMHTKHASVFGAQGPYVLGREDVLAGLRSFVATERGRA